MFAMTVYKNFCVALFTASLLGSAALANAHIVQCSTAEEAFIFTDLPCASAPVSHKVIPVLSKPVFSNLNYAAAERARAAQNAGKPLSRSRLAIDVATVRGAKALTDESDIASALARDQAREAKALESQGWAFW
jgi:hypothetical protein